MKKSRNPLPNDSPLKAAMQAARKEERAAQKLRKSQRNLALAEERSAAVAKRVRSYKIAEALTPWTVLVKGTTKMAYCWPVSVYAEHLRDGWTPIANSTQKEKV